MHGLIWFFSFFFFCSSLFAEEHGFSQQKAKEFQLELISPQSQVKRGESFLIAVRIKLFQDWYSYWSFAGDFGQAPKIKWKTIENVKIHSLPFPIPKRKSLSINKSQAYSFIYEKELLIPFRVFIEENYKEDNLPLHLDLQWFVCKELCISKENSLDLNLDVAGSFKVNPKSKKTFDFWDPFFPKEMTLNSLFKVNGNKLIINFSFKEEIKCLDIFPQKNEDFSAAPPLLLNQSLHSCSFQVGKSKSNLSKISGLLVYSKQGEKQSTLFQSYKHKSLGLLWFILMAFLGGLILNVMPCVLPIIFLKFYNTLELKHLPSRKIIFLNLSYTFGVIASFLFLAFFIFISKQMGESLGWGFHLQSPIFVTFLALLFTFMAFYLLNLISFATPKVSLLFKDEKLFSHFITGILSTTAASPCTVPFMASAVGFAFSRSYIEIFIIFFFLGLGLSFPYLALSFFPKALKYIPSPGPWTEVLKKLLSIPLFLTSFWLLRILYLQVDLRVFLLSLLAFPFLLLWLFFQKTIRQPVVKRVLTFGFICLILALFILQKTSYRSFAKNQLTKQNKKIAIQGLDWMVFDTNKILFDKQQGKNIFVVIGAEWCLTCKLNERIFKNQEFKNLIQKNKIQLYYGDWTNKQAEITDFLESYAQQGVPFYIFFQGEERVFIFPTLLFKKSFFKKLNELAEQI